MKTVNLDLLVQQIQRMLIADEDKQRLLKELEKMNHEQRDQLEELIQEHDQEALEVLDKKAAELEGAKQSLNALRPDQEVSEQEAQGVVADLKQALSNPKAFATLLANSDDALLKEIEQMLVAGLQHNADLVEECHDLFREVRLQKAAFIEQDQQEQKELFKEAVISRKQQVDRLDNLIHQAEKMLGKQYQK